MHFYVHSSVIYNSQDLVITWMPISRWADKKAVVHLHNGIPPSHKKEEILTFCNIMDRTRDYYAKWNKSVNERQIPYDLTYKWTLTKINKLMSEIE